MQKHAEPLTTPVDESADCASDQSGTLLWILARCVMQRDDPEVVLAALRHFDLLAANPNANPRLRLVCARLATQWRDAMGGTPAQDAQDAPVQRTLH